MNVTLVPKCVMTRALQPERNHENERPMQQKLMSTQSNAKQHQAVKCIAEELHRQQGLRLAAHLQLRQRAVRHIQLQSSNDITEQPGVILDFSLN